MSVVSHAKKAKRRIMTLPASCVPSLNYGDRVLALDGASLASATGLLGGASRGSVVCFSHDNPTVTQVLVCWDGWTSGHAGVNSDLCDETPVYNGVGTVCDASTGYWWVSCDDIFQEPPAGVQVGLAVSDLPAYYTTLYDTDYSDGTDVSEDFLVEDPAGAGWLFVGAKTSSTSSSFAIGAFGKVADVLSATSSSSTAYLHNGAYWYYLQGSRSVVLTPPLACDAPTFAYT